MTQAAKSQARVVQPWKHSDAYRAQLKGLDKSGMPLFVRFRPLKDLLSQGFFSASVAVRSTTEKRVEWEHDHIAR